MARKKQTAVSDEQIVAALMTNGTQRAAAAAVGIDERTIYNRMNDGAFQAVYKSAKADLIRGTVSNLNMQIQSAIETVVDVMTNKENNAAVRLQAAQTILNNASKFSDRLQNSETLAISQAQSNHWHF